MVESAHGGLIAKLTTSFCKRAFTGVSLERL